MAVSDKQKSHVRKSDAKFYEYRTVKLRQEWDFVNTVKQAAEANGESVNGFMVRAIRDKVESLGFSFPVPVLPEKPTDEA